MSQAIGATERRGDAVIKGITHDSRRIRPDWLFMAARGMHSDGHSYAVDAVEAGAAALVVEQFLDVAVPQLRIPSVNAAMGPLAATFYGHPSHRLAVIGVTGTNGKTTTCGLLRAAIESQGWPAGQIGTIETRFAGVGKPATMTTPEATDLQETLARMVEAGVKVVAMEVSSHALDQQRVHGTRFEVGVFTNLSPEHLDYHGTVEHYWASKAKLFEPETCRRALICVDDPWGERLAAQVTIPKTTFGSSSNADIRVRAQPRGLYGTLVELDGIDGGVMLRTRMIGAVNAADVAAAYLAARSIGIEPERAKSGIEACPPPPGRFELVRAGQPYLVVVDYAHTPDALETLIASARSLTGRGGQIHVVVGARGGRDRFKRPLMGRAAATADRVVFTADSPGAEDPSAITDQIRVGTLGVDGVEILIEPDRRRAIEIAIGHANAGDVVLIVGRGHETVQHIGGRSIAFDDRKVAKIAIEESERRQRNKPRHAPKGNGTESRAPVSVVIPAHNAAGTLSTAITSALSQTYPPLEVLVIDDGSTDETSEVASAMGPLVDVTFQQQQGPSVARNTGILRARGKWIAFLDADDSWHPAKLELQLDAARRHQGSVIIASDWSREPPAPTLSRLVEETTLTTRDILVLNRFQTSTVLFDRDLVTRLGGFDSRLDGVEDWDLWLRASRHGPVVKIDSPLVHYSDRQDSYSKNLGKVYETMGVMLERELGEDNIAQSLRTIRAWHQLRWFVAFRLAGDTTAAHRCLTDLFRLKLGRNIPAATARYLGPFLLRRLGKRLRHIAT